MKTIIILSTTAIVMISLLVSMSANATCTSNNGNQVVTATMNPIVVERDAPIGTVIGTINVPAPPASLMTCTGNSNYIYYESVMFNQPSGISNVYDTNLNGVGINTGPYASPAWQYVAAPENATGSIFSMGARVLNVVKTGKMQNGIVGSGILLRNYGGDLQYSYTANLIGSSVTVLSCSINSNSIQVSLDDVPANDLTEVGTTAKPKVFSIDLECDAGARINAKLTGIKNSDTNTNGVMQLSGAGGANVATGVGIQILYNNAPVVLNNNIVLKTSAGGQETFPFTAQYYQTKTGVTAGSANATATLELTYQ